MRRSEKYTFDDTERHATAAIIQFRAADRAPTAMARQAHAAAGQARLYHVYESWKAGWR